MTVQEFITELQKFPMTYRILIYDHDSTKSYDPDLSVGESFTARNWDTVIEPHVEITLGVSPVTSNSPENGA